MFAFKFFSANVSLLLSTISDSYAKNGIQESDGSKICIFVALAKKNRHIITFELYPGRTC